MRTPIRATLITLLWASFSPLLIAKEQTKDSATKPKSSEAPVFVTEVEGLKEFALANGLKVILFPDASKPRVTVNITYLVGSRHEGYGEAGMAHLLEHMLFKGTPDRPDIWRMLQTQGATFNATTWFDRTNYFETLPASPANLDFALGLEADRMVNSSIAPDALAKEFSVVRNEFEKDENDPSGTLSEQVFHTAYQWHGYGRTTIGNRSDIEKVPAERLREFYKKFYQPDNAVLVVAGAFDEKQALDLIVKNFAGIARPSRKLMDTYTVEPQQEGEREIVLRRQGENAIVGVAYHGVAGSDPMAPAIATAVSALTHKPSGILYKELVLKGWVTEIGGGAYSLAEPGMIYFSAVVAKGKDPREVSRKMTSLIESLKPEQITEKILRRYKADVSRSFDLAMADSSGIAVALSTYAAQGDWRLFFVGRDRAEALTLGDAQKGGLFFKPANRTLGLFLPTKNTEKTPLVMKPDVAAIVKDYKGRVGLEMGEAFEPSFDNIMARTTYSQFPNGMKVAMMPKKSRGSTVSLTVDMPLGSTSALKGKMTALHILPRMMLRGTKKRDYETFRDDLALLKASINGGSSWDIDEFNEVSFSFTTIKSKLPEVITLFGEVLREPRFDPEQFAVAKKEWITALQESREDPSNVASRAFLRSVTAYPKDDIRYIPTFDEEIKQVEALTLNDVKSVYTQLLGGSAGRAVVVGDFDPEAVKTQLQPLIGDWKAKVAYEPIVFSSKPVATATQTYDLSDKKGAQVAMGQTFSFKESDPRFAASRIVGLTWGGGAISRLINRLRQKDGLSYGASGSFRADGKSDVGYLSAFAICAPENVSKAIAAIRDEAARFQKDGLTEAELQQAKTVYAEQRRGSLSRDGVIMDLMSRNMELSRTFAFNKELDEKVANLKLDDVNTLIRDVVSPEKFFAIEALDKQLASRAAKGS